MRIFGREPALWLAGISATLSLLVTLNIGLSDENAALIVAAITGVFGAVTATLTRPIAPSAFTTAVTAVAALVAGFGFEIPPQTIGALNGLVLTGLMLLTRDQVTPVPPSLPTAGSHRAP